MPPGERHSLSVVGHLCTGGTSGHSMLSLSMYRIRVAYDSVYRQLFGYRSFGSVSNLQHFLGRKTWN